MPETTMFLSEPPIDEAGERAYEEDRSSSGYVMNVTRLWCWRPDVYEVYRALRSALMESSTLTDRDWAILVAATAAERRDSYCSLAWGSRLARLTDGATAAAVIAGTPADALSEREQALADWARKVVDDPNATTEDDVARLRELGLGDREIFEATVFVALRLAFSTVNDALGAAPDKQVADEAPAPVRDAVAWGRAPEATPSR
ncbi:MAG: hypothetical protein IRZ20_00145 [Thermoleophilia bacterium]|nr:hypothetical protein [Thermoleophilia bacterium]